MRIQGKVWGNTSEIFNKNNTEIHRIECVKGGYCSKHKHVHKHNMFFVESGKISIKIWKNDYDLVDETILNEKESTVVKPGEYHSFISLEDSVVYEIYWTSLSSCDIERKSVGGIFGSDVVDRMNEVGNSNFLDND